MFISSSSRLLCDHQKSVPSTAWGCGLCGQHEWKSLLLGIGGCAAPSPALLIPAVSRRSWKRKVGWVETREGAQLGAEEGIGSTQLGSHLPWCLEVDSSCHAFPSSHEHFFLLISPLRSLSAPPVTPLRATAPQPITAGPVGLQDLSHVPSPWLQKLRETKGWTKTLLLSSCTSSSLQRDIFPWASCNFCSYFKTALHPCGWAVIRAMLCYQSAFI